MPAPLPKVGTNGGGGPRGRAEGATRPYQRAALLTPQHIALHNGRMKRLNLTWGPHWSWGLMWSGSSRGWWVSVRKMQEAIFPQNPSRGVWEVGRVEGTSGGYPTFVVGAGDDSRCGQHPGASPKDTGLFWAPLMDEWGTQCWELLSGPTGTPFSLLKRFPLSARCEVPLLGPPGGTMKEDCSLCPGSTMLGWEGQSAYARSTTPFGEVCPGIT